MGLPEPLSVVVTTFNSADTLDACLRSVAWADEVVLLDSGSTDATLAIAAHYQAHIHAQPFAGYSAQKQAAIPSLGTVAGFGRVAARECCRIVETSAAGARTCRL